MKAELTLRDIAYMRDILIEQLRICNQPEDRKQAIIRLIERIDDVLEEHKIKVKK